MNNIVFKISKNLLYISSVIKDTTKDDLNNTNIIDTKEIVFSSDYIKDNLELVSSFLNVIIIKKSVSKVCIKDEGVISLVLDIINHIPSIKDVSIKPNIVISYNMFLKLLDNKYLESIDVYDIPSYLLERMDINKGLNVNIRSEILFVSKFMNNNNLNTYSDIYYKKHIIIDNEFDSLEYDDFDTFMGINNHLKVIEFSSINKEVFNYIMDKVFLFNLENIKVQFNEEKVNLKDLYKIVNSYKKHHERKLREHNIVFKVNYSDDYKKENMFKQINLNFIKISLIAVIMCVALMMSINIYRNYTDNKKYEHIQSDLKNLLVDVEKEDEGEEFEYIEPEGDDLTTTTSIYEKKYDKVFDKLLEINNDTVGWLTVNNTKIDYPVVRSNDNDFYLKRDYYKNSNRHGWIFMDYRNTDLNNDKNIIIYGHNLANQTMFGTLRYALNSGWYKKTANQVITFNSLEKNMRWQIISIYNIPVTSDYLSTNFGSDESFMNYVKLITERSIYDFGVSINSDDRILTLSTCSEGHEKRLVIHAKLIAE